MTVCSTPTTSLPFFSCKAEELAALQTALNVTIANGTLTWSAADDTVGGGNYALAEYMGGQLKTMSAAKVNL